MPKRKDLIKCINTRTGKIQYLTEYVVNNKALMEARGWEVFDADKAQVPLEGEAPAVEAEAAPEAAAEEAPEAEAGSEEEAAAEDSEGEEEPKELPASAQEFTEAMVAAGGDLAKEKRAYKVDGLTAIATDLGLAVDGNETKADLIAKIKVAIAEYNN